MPNETKNSAKLHPKEELKKDRVGFLPILFLLVSAFFIYLFFLPEPGSKTAGQKSTEEARLYEQKVNQHLFQTSQQIQLNHSKAQLEANRLALKGVESQPGQDPEKSSHPLDLSTDSRADGLARDLNRESAQPGSPKTPGDLIQSELFQEQQLQAYSEEYKKAYAQQFIENAKKAGYLVKLNEQYKVISVQPLRAPSTQLELFGSKGAAIQ